MSFRIIHIEDCEVQSKIAEAVLEKTLHDKEDYVYKHCTSLQEGLSNLDEGCLDIIILDLFLPDSVGASSVMKVKEKCPHTPIVVLTSDSEIQTAKECVRAGADGYVLKENIKTLPLIVILIIEKWDTVFEKKIEHDRYKSIAEDTPDWIIRFTASGVITYANRAACLGLEKQIDELIGKSVDSFLNDEQIAIHNETIKTITQDEPHVYGKDFWLNNRLIQWRKSGIFDHFGRLKEIQAIGRDVTEQHLMMEQLVVDAEKLVSTSMAAKDELLENAKRSMEKALLKLEKLESDSKWQTVMSNFEL